MKLPFDLAVEAAGARVLDAENAPPFVEITTDTRTIVPGQTFLALRGDRYDGHDYAPLAVEHGAAALVLSEAARRPQGVATLLVEDTLRAYLALARAARDRSGARVLAITGSAGKTTTKSLASQLLAAEYGERVLVSPANENNEIGVSKLLLSIEEGVHEIVVVEMGARHYGDIATLVHAARPQVGVLTNVADAHLEIMGSRERLEETKWAIFGEGARAILNASDVASIRRAPALHEVPHWFFAGRPEENVPIYGRVTALVGARQWIEIDGDRETIAGVDVRLPGAHNKANLAGAIAAAIEFGVPVARIVEAIPCLHLPTGRYERIDLPNGVRLIYDAYNANAAGMIAALDAFAHEEARRHIALLGSMAELGESAADLHRRVGAHAAAVHVDVMLVGGEFAGELALGARGAGLPSERIVTFMTNDQAAQWVRENAHAGDAVLLKGSRKYKLEEIVRELRH